MNGPGATCPAHSSALGRIDAMQLETLLRRIAETPPEFLEPPFVGRSGMVHVGAVVHDTLTALGGPEPDIEQLRGFAPAKANELELRRLRLALATCWLLNERGFGSRDLGAQALAFLRGAELTELAGLVDAPKLIADADRREELARLTLRALGLRPDGETPAQAQDRLATVSSVEAARLFRESQAAEQRAREVREAMARKAAQEAADKGYRE